MKLATVPLAALAFATWAVYLGGLASLQEECQTGSPELFVMGINTFLPCSKQLRLYWFFMSWEFVIILALAGAAVTGKLASYRTALVGLFAIATWMFIQTSDTFLAAESLPYYESGTPRSRLRATVAGAIMTAAVNAIIVAVVGSTCESCGTPAQEAAKGPAAV